MERAGETKTRARGGATGEREKGEERRDVDARGARVRRVRVCVYTRVRVDAPGKVQRGEGEGEREWEDGCCVRLPTDCVSRAVLPLVGCRHRSELLCACKRRFEARRGCGVSERAKRQRSSRGCCSTSTYTFCKPFSSVAGKREREREREKGRGRREGGKTCVCVCGIEREREGQRKTKTAFFTFFFLHSAQRPTAALKRATRLRLGV